MISQTTGYALRALAHLSSMAPEERILAKDLARATEVPEPFLGKIMRDLGTAGLVNSVRGRGGGYFLDEANKNRKICDVIATFERMDRFDSCIMGEAHCPGLRACGLHDWWSKVTSDFRDRINNTTVSEMHHGGNWVSPSSKKD
jgi:Rrf2 family transcriptional regulator, iron-sulfur cluster assembly transcription factor